MSYTAPHYQGTMEKSDVSKIKGNANDEAKRYVNGIFQHLVGTSPWFSHEIGGRIELKEVNIWGIPSSKSEPARAQTVFEIEVTPDMCNIFGIMHGGCAAYLIDHCSVSSTIALGTRLGKDGSGLSQSMNIIWSDAAPLGCKLRIVNNSISFRGRTRTCRTEIWNGDKLCVSGVQSLVNAPKKMVQAQQPRRHQDSEKETPDSLPVHDRVSRHPVFAAKL
ncbi:hypothetical protein NMY22_g11680 [Coprinellus aureogranulatus]|nr:hypothetical protein NMY22_g11680 [Coprinellus aureogranulatus]